MTTREIDHLTVSSLLTLKDGEKGAGYVNGFDFDAIRNADGRSVEIAISNMETGFTTTVSMPLALIRQEAAADLSRRIEARGGLEMA